MLCPSRIPSLPRREKLIQQSRESSTSGPCAARARKAGTLQNAETNRQSPAPQGTVAPERNDKANTGASTGTAGS